MPLSALWMSETVAVAMATAHCNTLFAARPPMLAAASKPVKASGGGRGAMQRRTGRSGVEGVCGGIRRNANDPLPKVCPSLCGRQCPGQQREGVHVRVKNTTCMYSSENIPRRVCGNKRFTHTSHTHKVTFLKTHYASVGKVFREEPGIIRNRDKSLSCH